MSFSSAPDEETLGRVAGALAVDESFIEKDWFVVQAISALVAVGGNEIAPVFSGGTSLLKGYALIKRFSEDIDFKLALSSDVLALSGNQRRKALGKFHEALIAQWKAFGFDMTFTEARDGNGFLRVEMQHPTAIGRHAALRPHILVELSAKAPRLSAHQRPVSSFVARYRGMEPEVAAIACVDPIETAADKLSAFTWRMLTRVRGGEMDDPTIVRHLHDLAALEGVVGTSPAFPALLRSVIEADTGRGGALPIVPADRLIAMQARLVEDRLYADEYARFVDGMAFGTAGEIPTFEAAVATLERLCALVRA